MFSLLNSKKRPKYLFLFTLAGTISLASLLCHPTTVRATSDADALAAPAAVPSTLAGAATTFASSGTYSEAVLNPVFNFSLGLSPSAVTGSKPSTATITLSEPAPAGGLIATLSSSNTAVATVPSTITIPAGATSKMFNVTTKAVVATTEAVISATGGGGTQAATITVLPPVLSKFTLSSTKLAGECKTSTGKVTLSGKAPAGGVQVPLANTNPAATVPSSVTVPAGKTNASFTITGTILTYESRQGTVTASYGGVSLSKNFDVLPIRVNSMTLSSSTIIGGRTVTGTWTLDCPANPGGLILTMSSSNAMRAKTNPSAREMPVPAGTSSRTFAISTARVSATTNVTIDSYYNGSKRSVKLTLVPDPTPPVVEAFYAAPAGTPDGDGSNARPWDLATALDHPLVVKPGDTIWLRGGTYTGAFTSGITGTSTSPVTLRAYPGERAIIDGNGFTESPLTVQGAWTKYWGFEVTNSDPKRVTELGGSNPADLNRQGGIRALGPHNKFINIISHNNGSGIGFWSLTEDSEIYGCIIYNNGWLGPDRGHGHGIYTQNEAGTKRVVDTLVFNNFGYGFHVYSQLGQISGLHLEGNASFNNGSTSSRDPLNRTPNFYVGDGAYDDITITNNYLYHPIWADGTNLSVGNRDGGQNVVITDNHVIGGNPTFLHHSWAQTTVTGNTIYGRDVEAPIDPMRIVDLDPPGGIIPSAYIWDNNRYFNFSNMQFNLTGPNGYDNLMNFAAWRLATGLDQNSQYTLGQPTGVEVFLRPNQYDSGRAHIIVYNWAAQSTVTVNVSSVLPAGARFEVRNVQDYFGAPVLTGTYNGQQLVLPTSGLSVERPIGYDFTPAHTGPEFNAYVLLRLP